MKVNLILLIFLSVLDGYGQQWQLSTKRTLSSAITSISIDQEHAIYVGTAQGNLIRYNEQLENEVLFSEINLSPITLVESWNRLKVFLFFQENQQIYLLDRFATRPNQVSLPISDGFIQMAAPGSDNSIWIIESTSNELRKYAQNQLLLRTPLFIPGLNIRDIDYLRAYQNFIILFEKGIGYYLFDQFGNYLKKIELAEIKSMQLVNNKVICLTTTGIYRHTLSTGESVFISPPPGQVFDGAYQVSPTSYLFYNGNTLYLFLIDG